MASFVFFLLLSYIVLWITFRINLPYQITYTMVHFCNCGQTNVVDDFPADHAELHYNSCKQPMQPWCVFTTVGQLGAAEQQWHTYITAAFG